MWMSRWFLALGSLALPAALIAQEAAQPTRPQERLPAERGPQTTRAPQERTAPATQLTAVENFFLGCLTQANQGEVALGRIAEQRATNKEVQAFAEQMVKDHGKMLAQLQQFAPAKATADKAVAEPATDRAPPERRAAPGGQDTVQAIAQINEEIHKRCMTSAMEALESKKGDEFDKCYVGMQLAAHQHMTDALAVLKNHATTPELRQLITQGAETTEQHLAHAKNLMKTLERESTGTAKDTAKRDSESDRK
jgi:putative membrane protein